MMDRMEYPHSCDGRNTAANCEGCRHEGVSSKSINVDYEFMDRFIELGASVTNPKRTLFGIPLEVERDAPTDKIVVSREVWMQLMETAASRDRILESAGPVISPPVTV